MLCTTPRTDGRSPSRLPFPLSLQVDIPQSLQVIVDCEKLMGLGVQGSTFERNAQHMEKLAAESVAGPVGPDRG